MKEASVRRYYKSQTRLSQIGKKIREVRIKKNLSQQELAKKCKVDYSQINRMELGKVNFSVSYLFKIASVLGTDAKDLLP
jgi:transcriptional regulator with XRE-family HTH domain